MGFAGVWRQQRNIEECGVGGSDGAAVREQDGDAWVGWAPV